MLMLVGLLRRLQ